ncbi:hypothetical protein HYS96_02245 [Candidatus Daviesbacteria bacterium]|nr:hypothetical protein [Candidatus Daviesbacteria bacterium]
MSLLKKPLVFILIAGIFIRLFLSATTFHSDIQHFDLAGYVLGKGNLSNFYDYTLSLNKDDQFLKKYPVAVFNYPPTTYFYLGGLNWILTSWTDHDFHNNFLFDFTNTLGDLRLYLHLILLKVPYLPFDIFIAYLLYNLYALKREKILAFTLWIFNPWVLYSTYMIGQFDIIPTAFVVLALYMVVKIANLNKAVFLAAILLGVGASFKIYPLLFLLPLAFLLPTWSKRIQAIFLGVSVYVVTILPFINSLGYRSTALAANQMFKSLYAQIPISGGEGIILFVVLTGFFYLIYLYRAGSAENLWQRFFVILLLFFIFTHYHPQWFLWLTPFLIIELIHSNFKHAFLLLVIAITFLGSVSLFEQSLSIGLFTPLNPSLYNGANLWQLLNIKYDLNLLRSLFQSLFVSVAGYLIYYYFPKKSG